MKQPSNRRNFIKALAATAATALITPGVGLANVIGTGNAGPRVSLLAGRSRLRPQFAANLELGLRLGLEQAGARTNLRLRQAHSGSGQFLIAAENVLRDERPELLLAVHHPGAAADLGALAQHYGSRVLLVDTGANVPRLTEEHPRVQFAGMNQWRADYALGRWAAAQGGPGAVIITSLYDTGYDLVSAYAAGFQAGGGDAPTVLLTDDPMQPEASVASVLSQVDALVPDVVHVLHSGVQAAELYRGLGSRPMRTASSLTLDDASGRGFRSVSAWLATDRELQTMLRNARGERADEVAMFGFHTGLRVAAGTAVAEPVQLQLFEATVLNGQPGRRVIESLADDSASDAQMTTLAEAVRTGWNTPWLTL